MSNLKWFDLGLPRDMTLSDVTAMLRPLASRPRLGLTAATPVVAFEVWSSQGDIAWRLGADARLSRHLPHELSAQLPRLSIEPSSQPRPALTLAAELRMDGIFSPLRSDTAGAVASGLLAALRHVRQGEIGVVQWLVGPSRRQERRPVALDLFEALGLREPHRPDATVMRLWRDKTAEPLYACRGRIGALASTSVRGRQIVRQLADALKLANTTGAGLRLGRTTSGRAAKLSNAAAPFTWSCLLNATELATLLAWPISDAAGDDLHLTGGHINRAPAHLLESAEGDAYKSKRVLGESLHAGQRGELVTVPTRTSLHHLHVVGPTGSGKSTLLAGMVTADINAGHSALIVEPRGDLVNDILARLPENRRDRVAVIDPANAEKVIGLNVLAGNPTQAERRADDSVHLLSELHGGNLGPRSTDIALHAFITVARLPDGTICDVPILLTNPAFRRKVLAQVSDALVLGPWWSRFDALSDAERSQHVSPLLNKLRPLTSREALRRMIGQAAPKFQLDDIFTRPGTVVLVNLNRGLLGTPTANLLGALLLSQVWSAIQRRAGLTTAERHPVMCVVDEFQDYLRTPGGLDFGDALAQSRGLAVGWTLAHQHMEQLSAGQQAAVLANARSRVIFRPSPADAKALAAAMGSGLKADDLLRLRAFEACAQLLVDSQPTNPFSVRTRPLPPWSSNPEVIRHASLDRYGVDGLAVDAELMRRWQGNTDAPNAPVGFKKRRS